MKKNKQTKLLFMMASYAVGGAAKNQYLPPRGYGFKKTDPPAIIRKIYFYICRYYTKVITKSQIITNRLTGQIVIKERHKRRFVAIFLSYFKLARAGKNIFFKKF